MKPFSGQPRRPDAWLVAIVVSGVCLRLVMLVLAGRLEPYSDESNYLYLALLWERFGFYSDSANYLWPPAFPYVLKRAIELFGPHGPTAVKLLQIGASAVVGTCTMLIARLVIDPRAAKLAGLIWCFYLPLIGFTHYLWPETFFLSLLLPSLYLLLKWGAAGNARNRSELLLLTSGLLLGLAVLFKEVGLFLLPVFCLWVFLESRDLVVSARVGRAVLLCLAFSVVVTPWTMRNFGVYGRFVPVGATLGKNLFMGVNAEYKNLDYPQSARRKIRAANRPVIRLLTGNRPTEWTPSTEINVIDRSKQNLRRGLGFAFDHPGFFARTRVKNVADWSSPMSFYLRHIGLERYRGVLDLDPIRRLLIGLALLLPLAVLAGTIPGLMSIDERATRWLLIAVIALSFLSGALVNGSTRYRIAIEPLLILLAAGFYSRPSKLLEVDVGERTVIVFGCLVLVALWALNLREVSTFVGMIW